MARPGLTTHRKFRRLARALGSPILARGVLELMWETAYEAGEDYVGTAEDLAAAVGWKDDADTLACALADAGQPEGHGFIEPLPTADRSPRRYLIHDLWHHAPDYVQKRRRRELDRRGRTAPEVAAPNGGQRLPCLDSQPGDALPPSPSPSPAPSPVQGVCAEMSAPPLLEFPTIGKGGDRWALTSMHVGELSGCFPGVDIVAEARKALAWVRSDPKHRKTASGMPRFLANWVTRGVNRGDAARLTATPAAAKDWYAECQRLHGGKCGGQFKHSIQMRADANRARGAAS